MTHEEIVAMIETLRARWITVLGAAWEYHNSMWNKVFNSGGMLPWSNFFRGPFAGNEYYTRALVDAYGIPVGMAHQLGQRITLNNSTGQYYIRMNQADAIEMSFNGLAGFTEATGFPVS